MRYSTTPAGAPPADGRRAPPPAVAAGNGQQRQPPGAGVAVDNAQIVLAVADGLNRRRALPFVDFHVHLRVQRQKAPEHIGQNSAVVTVVAARRNTWRPCCAGWVSSRCMRSPRAANSRACSCDVFYFNYC